MGTPPLAREFVCHVVLGSRSFRLALKENPEMEGWTYSVFDVSGGRFLIPESPVPDLEEGKRCAEVVIREIAFSNVQFTWKPKE